MTLPPESEAELLVLGPDEELIVFRIVESPNTEAADYVESFKSHAELGIPPRPLEQTNPVIYEGISAFDTAEAALETARRYPRLGRYVARLNLTADMGIRFSFWGARGHLTVWGEPVQLAASTVDTISVDEGSD